MAAAQFQGRTVFCTSVQKIADVLVNILGFERAGREGGDLSLRVSVSDHPEATVEYYLHPAIVREHDNLGTFQVDDVDTVTRDFIAAGWPVVGGPADTPWGVREATVQDDDKHDLTLRGPSSS